MIGKFIKASVRYCLPYMLAFALGSISGSGVLSKQKPDYFNQKEIVSDNQGNQYMVDLKNKSLEIITDRYQKKEDSKLEELLGNKMNGGK